MRVALAGIAILALALLVPYTPYVTDDSYIHFQFAKHLLRGEGFAFNAHQPTYGATSPLWVLLLSLAGALVPGAGATPGSTAPLPALAWIAKAYGALFTVAAVLWSARLARRLGWDARFGLAIAAMAALHPWSLRWAISGMESPLAFFAAVASLDALAAALLEGRSAWRPGVALAVASLARPECLLLTVIGGAAITASAPSRSRLRRAASFAAGFFILYGVWLAVAWAEFHRFLPNTSAAKAGAWLDPTRALAALRDIVRIALASEGAPVALAVVVFAFGGWERLSGMSRSRRWFWIAVAVWPVALALSFALTGVQVVSRYLLPAAPCVLLLGVAAFRSFFTEDRVKPALATAALVLYLGVHAAESLAVTFRVSAPSAREHAEGLRASLGEIGVWARETTPPRTLFAVSDIGAFGYYSDRPVLDLYGLVTPSMGPIVVREGYESVVRNLRFEGAGRPEYLVDRGRVEARLTAIPDPESPYRFLFARKIPNLGITRAGEWFYSVYAIDWGTYDRHHPRIASR